MEWKVNDDVSFCRFDDRLVFLDIDKDRYFHLSKTLEQQVLDFVDGKKMDDQDLRALANHNVLLPSAEVSTLPAHSLALLARPTRSVPEMHHRVRASMPLIGSTFTSVVVTGARLRRQPLKGILEALTRYRQQHIAALKTEQDQGELEQQVINAAAAFCRVRPYVPIKPRCLIDSLSLVALLAKRGLPATLVIAVACDPFSAHAWAQYRDIVLNDTVGNAWHHTPIRMI